MADLSELDPMFPKLNATQIARLLPVGRRRRFGPGEMVYERGSAKRAFYVLLEGHVEIASPSRMGEERVTIYETGEFTGEVDMISGRQSLVGARALDATELLEIDVADLRRIVQTDSELSELFLRAFALRHAHLIANTLGGVVLIGSGHSADTLRLKPEDLEAARWPLKRRPYQFETSLPRVFAVGDVRSGSMKRVAAAVGEGSAAVQLVHKVLAE